MCLSDFAVLETLLHKGSLNVQELGAKVMLTSGSMTAALDRMERRGLIKREEDEKDRRARAVRLTETGERLIRAAFEDHKQAMEQAVGGIQKRDREGLIELLRQVGLGAAKRLVEKTQR
jgi:MarR family 2-MHQ and catechol resistance regulon transcriptional repressor